VRAPQAVAWLRKLAERPQLKSSAPASAPFIRNLGYSDDEVVDVQGQRMTATEAKRDLGSRWFLSTEFTGYERITEAGRQELARHA
jgi:hypothetical protein